MWLQGLVISIMEVSSDAVVPEYPVGASTGSHSTIIYLFEIPKWSFEGDPVALLYSILMFNRFTAGKCHPS